MGQSDQTELGRQSTPSQEAINQKVMGSNPGAGKNNFHYIFVKVFLYIHRARELTH